MTEKKVRDLHGDDFVPNMPFSEMTPEEVALWHREEYEIWEGETIEETLARDEAEAKGDAGWYYSSVVQWMPEHSTEKINGYSGPYPTWQDALAALFEEIGSDIESLEAANSHLVSDLSALQGELGKVVGVEKARQIRDRIRTDRRAEARKLKLEEL